MRLFLDGDLQFSSRDEHRYTESLVHPALARDPARWVLILGGGDGLAAREALRHPVGARGWCRSSSTRRSWSWPAPGFAGL